MGHSRKPTSKEITILERIFIYLQFLLRKSFMRVFLEKSEVKEKQNKKRGKNCIIYLNNRKTFRRPDRLRVYYFIFYIYIPYHNVLHLTTTVSAYYIIILW